MNIWILNHYATPPDTPGSTRHYDFARELVRQGHNVTIFAAGFSHRTRKEERLKKGQNYRRDKINGVDFVWLKTSPYYGGNDWRRAVNMLSYAFRIIPLGIRLKEKPDVILASSPHPLTGFSGWLLAKFKKAAFVFEVRDLWPQTLVEIGGYNNNSFIVKMLAMLEKFLYQRAHKIIVLLPKASDYITGLGIDENKIAWIPNGVSTELFADSDAKLPDSLGEIIENLKSKGAFLAVYAGAHGIANALNTILDAAELIQKQGADKIHFLLVGDGPEKKKLKGRAISRGFNNISFHKSIPKKNVPLLLKASDIVVMSWNKSNLYRDYGMSTNKLWDYMMAAKPVVWAIDSANDPVAEARCGITVPPDNPEAMATAILNLCQLSQKELNNMGNEGYQYVTSYYSVPVLAKKLLKVIEESTDEANRAGGHKVS